MIQKLPQFWCHLAFYKINDAKSEESSNKQAHFAKMWQISYFPFSYIKILNSFVMRFLTKIVFCVLMIIFVHSISGKVKVRVHKLQTVKSGRYIGLKTTYFNLANKSISVLQPGAFQNSHFQRLLLSKNRLKKLSNGVFKDVSVEGLYLNDNIIQRIERGTLENLLGLTVLDLSHNRLEEIDPEAFNVPELRSLSLKFNLISTLKTGNFKHLPQLRSLDLTQNKISKIQEGVFNQLKVTHLRLSHNQISSIAPRAFDDMFALVVLHLDHNKIAKWDNHWLHNTPKLRHVVAEYNYLEEIPAEAFKNYPRVHSIDFQGNRIKKIAPNALAKAESISIFDLRDNNIDYWDEKLLAKVNFSSVLLNNNKIKCIDDDLKVVFRRVNFAVHFWGNSWDPACPVKTDYFEAKKRP